MIRRTIAVLAALAAASAFAPAASSSAGASGPYKGEPPLGPGTAGPPYKYTTQIIGQFGGKVPPLKNQAMLTRTKHGYRYWAGQQKSHLVLTQTESGALRLRDTGTQRLRKIPSGCYRQRVNPGVAAVCGVPSSVSTSRPLLIEIWPRLGSDFVDGSSLPATFAMTVLGDKGNDTALFGAGPDFFNGFTGRDRISGGGGNDWIRGGKDADRAFGGAGADQIVDTSGRDLIAGGDGTDHIWAGPGNDRVRIHGDGADRVMCSGGHDRAWADHGDQLSQCNRVYRS